MTSDAAVVAFLAASRIAVVGASDDRANFGGSVYLALRSHGYDVVAVNPGVRSVCGDVAYPDIRSVPAPLDGVIVMVNRAKAPEVVRACVERPVPRVWLFKGIGGPGAVSDEAVRLCEESGIDVVAGACPLMFLEPVGVLHRLHRRLRHANGSLAALP